VGAGCALIATVLRNFASYSTVLAGYTAAIITSDQLGATGDAFFLAVYRASEICMGIVSAGIVLAETDLGGGRRRLATLLAPSRPKLRARSPAHCYSPDPNFRRPRRYDASRSDASPRLTQYHQPNFPHSTRILGDACGKLRRLFGRRHAAQPPAHRRDGRPLVDAGDGAQSGDRLRQGVFYREANDENLTLKEAALALGEIDENRFDEIVDPRKMVGHGVSGS
jgi:Fusaric acid resistance protein family